MSGRRREGDAVEQGGGLARRCHLTGEVVDGVTFEVRAGEVSGLLGPNGADTST